MRVLIVDDGLALGRLAAGIVASAVVKNPRSVLGLATGSSPLAVYAELGRRVDAGELDLRLTTAFALDDYVGLRAGHPQSYRSVIDRDVVRPLRMTPSRVVVPDGNTGNQTLAAEQFERSIHESGGIDVQLLGIGSNSHIGFNEPSSPLDSRTRVVALTRQTRADNSRFFPALSEVPTHAITQGLGTILEAKHLVLIARGRTKAAAIAAAIEGPVSFLCPASVLQTHPMVTVILDHAAASGLSRPVPERPARARRDAPRRR